MKQRLVAILLCLILLLGLALPVTAASDMPMVVDSAGLLTASEAESLENKAQALRSEYALDVVILTVDSMNGVDAQSYADTFYDQNGYGYGENGDGILFLLAMSEREWYISTCGDTIYAITDYCIQQLGITAVWYIEEGYYYDGFDAYLDALPPYLDAYDSGTPVDGYADYSGDYYHGSREEVVYYEEDSSPNIFLSLVIGIVAATVVILVMRSSMNTKKQQRSASGYLKAGSFHLRSHQDLFLYSNVSKVRRQQTSTSSHRGGGSSVHRSSGGRRHGGGGGRF